MSPRIYIFTLFERTSAHAKDTKFDKIYSVRIKRKKNQKLQCRRLNGKIFRTNAFLIIFLITEIA